MHACAVASTMRTHLHNVMQRGTHFRIKLAPMTPDAGPLYTETARQILPPRISRYEDGGTSSVSGVLLDGS